MGSAEINSRASRIISEFRPPLAAYEDLYRWFHANPELSHQEKETSARITRELRQWDFKIHENIGGYGVVAVLENGPGKTVLLRADMDALPVEEKTGLPYASKKRGIDIDGIDVPIAHACGHDVHVTTLLATAETLFKARAQWSGTLICLFQPAEEKGRGAKDMIADDVYKKIGHTPDIVLGGHASPHLAGTIHLRPGILTSNSNSFNITLYGRGGHGSMPESTVDPVLLASHCVVRLQSIVSREIGSHEAVVLTIGSIVSGETENIIPDHAVLKVNIRSYKKEVCERVIASMKRIIEAECLASNSPKPPLIEPTLAIPLIWNDHDMIAQLSESFQGVFAEKFDNDSEIAPASEDFGVLSLAIEKPACFWFYGSTNPAKFHAAVGNGKSKPSIPTNHSPLFAPDIENTLPVAVDSYIVAALTWL